MTKNAQEVLNRVYERAGAIGELVVFHYAGGKFGVDSYGSIWQDFGVARGGWKECPNGAVRAHANYIGL